jgi:hypothetical protein
MTSDVAKLNIKNLLLEKYPAVTKVLSKKKVNQLIKDVYQVCSDDFDRSVGAWNQYSKFKSPYDAGWRYCRHQRKWLKTNELRCPECGYVLRSVARVPPH